MSSPSDVDSRSPIPVACAWIEAGGKVFLAQRPPTKHLGLKWEFPGGKIEPGETGEAAIVREIREELGCDIRVRRALPPFVHVYDRGPIRMYPFVCDLAPGSPAPKPLEHIALDWVAPGELRQRDLAAADFPVIDAYFATIT